MNITITIPSDMDDEKLEKLLDELGEACCAVDVSDFTINQDKE